MKRSLIIASIVVLLAATGSIALAQGPGQGPGPGAGQGWGKEAGFGKGHRAGGALHKLNRALQAGGAEALSSDQEECIAGEVEAFRANMPEFQGDGSGLALHLAYAQAVLNGDSAAIPGLAEEIALQMAARMQTRLENQAKLHMQVQTCLTADQLAALRSLDPKQQAWLVNAGPGRPSFARGQRGDAKRSRPGRN